MNDPDPLVRTDLPASVTVDRGEGGLPRVRVAAPAGTAEVYLHGAQVTAWAPQGQAPVLWLSAASSFAPTAAIRGGVPVCFPWFGAHATDPKAPMHGFARVADWALVGAEEVGDAVALTFRLADDEASRASAWPHPFVATYRVEVGGSLGLSLTVENTGPAEVRFEEALHSYYAVSDVRRIAVTGLAGTAYEDRLTGPPLRRDPAEPLRVTGETDRIYLDTTAATAIEDPGLRRVITVGKAGSRATVVWNPWVDKARAMADFGDEEWTGMVCVETCNVRDAATALAPGQQHTMNATIEVSDLTRRPAA